jgi:H+/Cl- antiporter ClcA
MASSAPIPKDWRSTRRGFVVGAAAAGSAAAWWVGPEPWSVPWRLALGCLIGALAGGLGFLVFRAVVRRLHRALAPKMRPDRLS